ncbi:MAG: amidohydrolase family protein, partial [Acidimicrobiaceae bacterium]|nr:amidohydrolase family protein [Acidimicrobiaceae bacterium]
YDPVYKVHPPLRTDADVEAVKAGLADGTIDAIATDHAPHTPKSKQQTFADAPPGMLGLETAFAVANTYLDMPIESLLGAMSWRPAAICGLNGNHGGPIEEGSAGNLTVIDPNAAWTVSAAELASRSSNTPYEGMALRGRVRHTIYKGEAVVIDGVAQR